MIEKILNKFILYGFEVLVRSPKKFKLILLATPTFSVLLYNATVT